MAGLGSRLWHGLKGGATRGAWSKPLCTRASDSAEWLWRKGLLAPRCVSACKRLGQDSRLKFEENKLCSFIGKPCPDRLGLGRAKLRAVKTAAALRPRSGAQRARNGHHLDRHILPRGFDFATTPSFRRLRPPGALQAAAPSAEPCRACRPRSSPLPRSWRQVQARRRAPMAVERQRKVVGLQLPSCLHCCLTCRRRLTMRLQSLIKSQG